MTGEERIIGLSVVLKNGSQVDFGVKAVYNFLTFEVSWLQRSEPGCRSKKIKHTHSNHERWETFSKPLDVWIQGQSALTPALATSLC